MFLSIMSTYVIMTTDIGVVIGIYVKRPRNIEISATDKDDLIKRIKTSDFSSKQQDILVGLIEFNEWLQFSVQEKNISIKKLQKIFGSGSEKRGKKNKNDITKAAPGADESVTDNADVADEQSNEPCDNEADANAIPESTTNKRKYAPNNGRMGSDVYTNANVIPIDTPYKVGDPCPEDNCNGKLKLVEPTVVVKIVGQSFANANQYVLEKLRCSLCEKYFSAQMPSDVWPEKYDPAFKAQLCVYKHFLGVPSYRLEGYQAFIGVPLPDSTQFDKIEDVANAAHPVFKQMEQFAANGHLIHGDDTHVRIQTLIAENKMVDDKSRKGMFTTGIVSFYEEYQIHLFYSGRHHCGENITALLSKRDSMLPMVKYMCDALGRNMPDSLKAVIINCLVHGRRNFTDIDKFFPEECAMVIDVIAQIYEHDAKAREQNYDDEQRLEHHKQYSAPLMEQLHTWLSQQLDMHMVEPNSSLGKAFKYMLKHWVRLTQFLRVPGAPLDNNIIERSLKIPIRVRKNSLFYATEHGAYVGSMLQSIICTCIAQSVNPVDYLTVLQVYKAQVRLNPSAWMPWNYSNAMAIIMQPTTKAA